MEFDSRYVDNQKDKFKKTNTLTFCYEFKYDNDMVFFTHFAPYSYSDVFRYLCKLEVNPALREFMRIDYICQSLGKVPMYGLTITHDIENDYLSQEEEIQLFRQFEYENLDVKPKKKKVLLPGLPGYKDPLDPNRPLAEIAHDKLLLPQVDEQKEAKNDKKFERKPTLAKNEPLPSKYDPKPVLPPKAQNQEEEIRKPRYKKYCFLTSRVHPGETNSQYMI